jgi:molybdenum cofactor cytidylyltransferase
MGNIGAIILAAGESSRFGSPKQLLQFRGKSLFRRAVEAANQAGCSPVVVVIAADAGETADDAPAHVPPTRTYGATGNRLPQREEKIRPRCTLSKSFIRELERTQVSIVENEEWRRGIGSSIRAGVLHLINRVSRIHNKEGRLPNPRTAVGKPPLLEAVVILVCDQPFVDSRVIAGLIALQDKTGTPIVASAYLDTLGVPALFGHTCFGELLQLGDDSGAKSVIMRDRERVAQFPFPQGAIDIDTVADYDKLLHNDSHTTSTKGTRSIERK